MLRPFLANVPQQVLDDLKLKINNTRWPDEIIGSGWNYGTNLSYMKELADYVYVAFAGMEQPTLLAKDTTDFFSRYWFNFLRPFIESLSFLPCWVYGRSILKLNC